MRFMVLVKTDTTTEEGTPPDDATVAALTRYNEALVRAGVLLAAEGLYPSASGARVRFEGDRRTVIAGPFPEPNDLVAGFWLLQVRSREEAIEWVKRIPNPEGGTAEIEIRQVYDVGDSRSTK